MMEGMFPPTEKYSPTGHPTISATTSIGDDPRDSKRCNAPTCPRGHRVRLEVKDIKKMQW